MIPSSLRSFISDLQDATENGKLKWLATDNNAFYCNHKNYTLHILYHFDEEKEMGAYYFRIVVDKNATPFAVTEEEDDYNKLRNLYEAIAANANNIEEKLKGFFD